MLDLAGIRKGRDITRGNVDYLPYLLPQDPILNQETSTQDRYHIYEQLLADDQVYSAFQQRRLAVIKHETEVIAGGTSKKDEMAAEFIRDIIKNLQWEKICKQMLYGRHYGFAVGEAMWTRDGRHIRLDNIKVRNRSRFAFDVDYKLKLLTQHDPLGEAMPDYKFWVTTTGSSHHDEPYGVGLGRALYWPVTFKREVMSLWLIAQEAFGSPIAVGKYPDETQAPEQKTLLEACQSLRDGVGIVIPSEMDIQLLQSTWSGRVDFPILYQELRQSISRIIIGQTMTSDSGSSESQANVHMEVRQDLVGADALMLDASFNMSIVKWLTEWNYPGAKPPKVKRNTESQIDLERKIWKDQQIYSMGYAFPKEYLERTYAVKLMDRPTVQENGGDDYHSKGNFNRDIGKVDHDSEIRDRKTQFGETETQAISDIINGDFSDMLLEDATALIEPILRMAEEKEPEEFIKSIEELFPELDSEQVKNTIARIIFIAQIAQHADRDEEQSDAVE